MSPVHVLLAGEVSVAAPPAGAFELFTPDGERRWAEGWDPAWLHPAGGALAPGAVFLAAPGGEETVWLVADVDREGGRVRYVRVTPGRRIGTVEVRCAPRAGGGTVASVTYELTATSPEGQRELGAFEAGFAGMLGGWERDIALALERERRAPPPPATSPTPGSPSE